LSFFGSTAEIATAEGVELHIFNAFPSGHSTTAFAVFFGLSLIARNKNWGFLLFVAAFVSAWSRVYLAQHFFEDVFFGSLIGVISSFVVYLLLFPRLDQPWAVKSLLKLKS
jgi:membrane-associated phospholipid phosphatase